MTALSSQRMRLGQMLGRTCQMQTSTSTLQVTPANGLKRTHTKQCAVHVGTIDIEVDNLVRTKMTTSDTDTDGSRAPKSIWTLKF